MQSYRGLSLLDTRWGTVLIALGASLICIVYGIGIGYAVSPLLLVFIPLALAIGLGALVRPEIGAVVLLSIRWGYLSEIAVRFHHVPSIATFLFALLVVAVVLRRFSGRQTPLAYDQTTWWMLAYLFVIALGLWYAVAPNRVMELLIDFAKSVLLYLVLINLITSIRLFERSMWLLLAVGALLGTLTLYQEITHSYDSNFGGLARMEIAQIASGVHDRPRASGTIGDPNAYGQLLLVLVPIGLWALVQGRTLLERIGAGYATCACLAGVVLSFSRGAYLALAVVLILFALHIRLNPRYLLVILPLIGLVWWFTPPEVSARFGTLEELLPGGKGVNSEESYLGRFVSMRMAINMFGDHPLLGVGGWNYSTHYQNYIREDGSRVADEIHVAHSYYLEIAAEHGLAGLLVVGGIIVLTLRRLRLAQHLFTSAGNRRMAELAALLQMSFAAYLVSAAFLPGSYTRYLWLQVNWAVALACIARRYVVLRTDRSAYTELLNHQDTKAQRLHVKGS